jgi:hypothetical protein
MEKHSRIVPRRGLAFLAALSALIVVSLLLNAQTENPVFRCSATDSAKECMFSVEHPDGSGGVLNFVLAPGEKHSLNDTVIGARYCVEVVPKHSGSNLKWPDCWDGQRRVKAPPALNE